jgi:hypothetical protein
MRWLPEDPEEFASLREKLSRKELAAHYGVSVGTIKRVIAALGLPPKPQVRKRPPVKKAVPKDFVPGLDPEYGMTLIERARARLAMRGIALGECRTGYTLNQRPVRVADVLKAAGIEESDAPERYVLRCDGGMAARAAAASPIRNV